MLGKWRIAVDEWTAMLFPDEEDAPSVFLDGADGAGPTVEAFALAWHSLIVRVSERTDAKEKMAIASISAVGRMAASSGLAVNATRAGFLHDTDDNIVKKADVKRRKLKHRYGDKDKRASVAQPDEQGIPEGGRLVELGHAGHKYVLLGPTTGEVISDAVLSKCQDFDLSLLADTAPKAIAFVKEFVSFLRGLPAQLCMSGRKPNVDEDEELTYGVRHHARKVLLALEHIHGIQFFDCIPYKSVKPYLPDESDLVGNALDGMTCGDVRMLTNESALLTTAGCCFANAVTAAEVKVLTGNLFKFNMCRNTHASRIQ
jgi:hypothetical protein